MIILELEDFDYWADNQVTGKDGVLVFSPMFVFLIDWAYKFNKIDESLLKEPEFNNAYLALSKNKIKFSEFVLDILDEKLLDTYFTEEARQFICDYIEYDGYMNDLSSTFKCAMWELPHELINTNILYDKINRSLANYIKNKSNYPDLCVFTDPEELKRQQD
ncbi:MAG: hypothetical protein OEY07_20085, partial [Gammaproteobacteria bacterium]|nr:hypothetical protein [Gammaproteobacteria bacterium]